MHALIVDAFCSSNRGDAAILDGIVRGLTSRGWTCTVASRFPSVCAHFHEIKVVDDQDASAMALAMSRAQLVVSCGGSFLNDIYAQNLGPRLATAALAQRMGVPYVVFGQSIGPLHSPLARLGARNALAGATWICVRDEASARTVREIGVDAPLRVGVDTAVSATAPRLRNLEPVLGVTARTWFFPGNPDAGGAQERYERALAAACDAWADETGGRVRILSNCTGFGGYPQDDRVAARRIAKKMRHATIVDEEDDLSFVEVRKRAASCDFFIGTRMHSLIFATTAGVPAFGVAYEFKTREWLTQLGCPEHVLDIEDCADLPARVMAAWHDRGTIEARIQARLPAMLAQAEAQLDQLDAVGRGQVPQVTRPAVQRAGWDQETWRYDRAHRRLRAVADVVFAEGGERVLDLGCSTGMLGRLLGPSYQYDGVDIAPSVAIDAERFRIRTSSLEDWTPEDVWDVVVCSGSLEYVADLPGTLAKIRAALPAGGLAVLTLFNLAHFARGVAPAHRHPTWRFQERPDDWVLMLGEAGLHPSRLFVSSAGYAAPSAVDAERPTDFDLDGGGQLPLPAMLRLGHHWVAVCRAGEPLPGPAAVEARLGEGDLLGALRIAADLVQRHAWAPRAWADFGVLMAQANKPEQARDNLLRALRLDPARPEVRASLDALGVVPAGQTEEERVLLDPTNPDAWAALVDQLAATGRLNAAAVVQGMGARIAPRPATQPRMSTAASR